MRFNRLLEEKASGRDLINIPVSEFEAMMKEWVHTMARGYRKKTRIHHLQEALDSIATTLEKHNPSSQPSDILSNPYWVAAVKVAKDEFPKETHSYYPTPGEQEIRFRLVRNSIATRLLRDKLILMREFRQSFKGTEEAHTNKAAIRLQMQMMASSAHQVMGQYGKSIYEDWETWHEWNRSQHDNGLSASGSRSFSAKGGNVNGSVSGSASASLSKGFEHGSKGDTFTEGDAFTASGEVGLFAEIDGSAGVVVDRKNLAVSASAGAEGFVGARAQVEFEVELTAKVRGKDINWLKVNGGTSTTLGAKFSAQASASAQLGGGQMGLGRDWDMTADDRSVDPLGKGDIAGAFSELAGVNASVGGDVSIGLSWQGEITAEVLETLEVGVQSEFFAGAKASAQAEFYINTNGVKLAAQADAFAGVEFSIAPTLKVKDRKRGLDLFTVTPKMGVSFGAGAKASASVEASLSNVGASASAEAAVGLGFDLGVSGGISPRTLALVCYDHIITNVGHGIKHVATRRCSPDNRFRKMVESIDHRLDVKADKSEVNQIYFQMYNEIVGMLTSLDVEADGLHRRVMKQDFRLMGRHVPEVDVMAYREQFRSGVMKYDEHDNYDGIDDTKRDEALQAMKTAQQQFMAATGKTGEAVDIRFVAAEMEKANSYSVPASKFGCPTTI